ncbi:MAG: DUF1127 domain-containing protein [Shimia sp.]
MAYAPTTTATPGLFARVGDVVKGQTARYAQFRAYRNTLQELRTLNDRELADLGLSRAGLKSAAYATIYGA